MAGVVDPIRAQQKRIIRSLKAERRFALNRSMLTFAVVSARAKISLSLHTLWAKMILSDASGDFI